jgi:hypothetical protein
MVVEVAREEVEVRPVDVALDPLPVKLALHHDGSAPQLHQRLEFSLCVHGLFWVSLDFPQLPGYLRSNLLSITNAITSQLHRCKRYETAFALLGGAIPSADPTQGKCVWFMTLRREF